MAIQGKQSNYDTDIFQNTIQVIEEMSGKKYGVNGTLRSDNYIDVAMRVIADHLRAVSFAIADGQLPSNAKAGLGTLIVQDRLQIVGAKMIVEVKDNVVTHTVIIDK
jgi:alanyl-tRNA synthetase